MVKTKKVEEKTKNHRPYIPNSDVVLLAEKKALHEKLITLYDDEWAMTKIMSIISPSSAEFSGTELEIDVARLPGPTIRKLQQFLREYALVEGTIKTESEVYEKNTGTQ